LGIYCKGKEFYNIQVWYFTRLHTKGRLLALSAYIKLGWNWLVLANVLVKSKAVIIMVLKRFIVAFKGLPSRVRLLAMSGNIRLGWKVLSLMNSLSQNTKCGTL
jgi:hypothetical protein